MRCSGSCSGLLVAAPLVMLAVHRSASQHVWGWAGTLAVGLSGGWFFFGLTGLETFNRLGSLVVAFARASTILPHLR